MLSGLLSAVRSGLNITQAALPLGLKVIKYFIDSTFREKVTPVPGSVLYCDLWVAVEHSGIYVGERQISNIVVEGVAEASVCLNGPDSFTSKSTLGRKIYVSCDERGAVGHPVVANGAKLHVGERSFYGLVIKNCHQFSTQCVNYAAETDSIDASVWNTLSSVLPGETWEPTMATLKSTASAKLGATKWRLWDWDNNIAQDPPTEPNWQAQREQYMNQKLNPETIARLRGELAALQAYETELADENIPSNIRYELSTLQQTLSEISQKYEAVKEFLVACRGAEFSYTELSALGDDFSALAEQMQTNSAIKDLARKMGRNYLSEDKKRQTRIPQASKSEVHGVARGEDLMRLLPSELINLEDETLEMLFYARLLEKNLLCYELSGTTEVTGEITERHKKRTGPVVACLDTSASMSGQPLIRAKALLLAIARLLQKESRSLHVLIFGGAGQLREFAIDGENNSVGLLNFLRSGFDGGTDFDTPLARALEIIKTQKDYIKADVLMISDGDCSLSPDFASRLEGQKLALDCSIYSVLCAGKRVQDTFSDEVVVL